MTIFEACNVIVAEGRRRDGSWIPPDLWIAYRVVADFTGAFGNGPVPADLALADGMLAFAKAYLGLSKLGGQNV